MIVVLKPGLTQEEIQKVVERIEGLFKALMKDLRKVAEVVGREV